LPGIDAIRERRERDIEQLDPGVKRLMNPHEYHVSLTQRLWDLKQEMIQSARSPLRQPQADKAETR
jgi:nicotinate phosphoribosyltransferase